MKERQGRYLRQSVAVEIHRDDSLDQSRSVTASLLSDGEGSAVEIRDMSGPLGSDTSGEIYLEEEDHEQGM
jgi:hypothetical protein